MVAGGRTRHRVVTHMAPNAKIYLVEAASNLASDLFLAVDVAGKLASNSGKGYGEVSMSWGFSEFSGETTYDRHFNQPNVVYVAASGDVGGQRTYPGVSPLVVSAGGTRINRDANSKFLSETA